MRVKCALILKQSPYVARPIGHTHTSHCIRVEHVTLHGIVLGWILDCHRRLAVVFVLTFQILSNVARTVFKRSPTPESGVQTGGVQTLT